MPELSGIYDSAYIQPIARIKENLSIWTQGAWSHYVIDFQEPIPPSPASTIEMVVASGATTLAANATITRQVIAILQPSELEFLQVRFEPLDNVEAVIWEQATQARFASRNIHARADMNTRNWDPALSTTTFFILGMNRDMQLEIRNPMGYATPLARVRFWGIRMILSAFPLPEGLAAADRNLLSRGDRDAVRAVIGNTTWLPAEGRGA